MRDLLKIDLAAHFDVSGYVGYILKVYVNDYIFPLILPKDVPYTFSIPPGFFKINVYGEKRREVVFGIVGQMVRRVRGSSPKRPT